MSDAYKLFVYILFCSGFYFTCCQKLQNCTTDNLHSCPAYSFCTRIDDGLNCVCLQGYKLNDIWRLNSSNSNGSGNDYCVLGNKTIVYIRSPARTEHLAIAIVFVLFFAILATALLYFITVLRPVHRTKAAYVKLQLRRNNHQRLQEFDEIDMQATRKGLTD